MSSTFELGYPLNTLNYHLVLLLIILLMKMSKNRVREEKFDRTCRQIAELCLAIQKMKDPRSIRFAPKQLQDQEP